VDLFHHIIKNPLLFVMCYSLKSSLVGFLIGYGLALFLFRRRSLGGLEQMVAMFSVCFSTMQLLEAFMWYDLTDSMGYNHIATRMGFVLLWLQPIALSLGGYIYQSRDKYSMSVIFSVCAFIVAMINAFTTITSFTGSRMFVGTKWCSTVGPHGHLVWQSPRSYVTTSVSFTGFLHSMTVPWLFVRPLWMGVLMVILSVLTLEGSLLLYGDTGEYASFWCYEAVFQMGWVTLFSLWKEYQEKNKEKKDNNKRVHQKIK